MYEPLIYQLLREEYLIDVNKVELISYSDKMVYKVCTTNKQEYIYDIYLKKQDVDSTANFDNNKFFTEEAIASEIKILHVLSENYPKLKTPSPIKNKSGQLVTPFDINGTSVQSMLRKYIAGNELVKNSKEYLHQAFQAGIVAAELHQCSNQYFNDIYTCRPVHRQQYVQNIINTIKLGIDVGTITSDQFAIVNRSLQVVIQRMYEMDTEAHYLGIVHTDLRDANLLFDGEHVIPIDFGRCVYGYLLYDLGEMCAHMGGNDSPVSEQIIKGYHSIRKLTQYDIVTIEAFKMLFILSVIAEQIMQKNNSYVFKTLKKLTEVDLMLFLSGKPVIQGIREVI